MLLMQKNSSSDSLEVDPYRNSVDVAVEKSHDAMTKDFRMPMMVESAFEIVYHL
jgi:hypothetical protein